MAWRTPNEIVSSSSDLKQMKCQSQKATRDTRVLLVTSNIHHWNAGVSQPPSQDEPCSTGPAQRGSRVPRQGTPSPAQLGCCSLKHEESYRCSHPAPQRWPLHARKPHTEINSEGFLRLLCVVPFYRVIVLVVVKQRQNITIQTSTKYFNFFQIFNSLVLFPFLTPSLKGE